MTFNGSGLLLGSDIPAEIFIRVMSSSGILDVTRESPVFYDAPSESGLGRAGSIVRLYAQLQA
jgi:hypothetical protein